MVDAIVPEVASPATALAEVDEGRQRGEGIVMVEKNPGGEIMVVFGVYGLAMSEAQCLENAMRGILTAKYPRNDTKPSIKIFDELSNKTFGTLVKDLVHAAKLEPNKKAQFKAARKKRDWLAHHYFADRVTQIGTELGRLEMFAELTDIIDFFRPLAESLGNEALAYKGFSPETLERYAEELRRKLGWDL